MSTFAKYASIIVEIAVDRPLEYGIPDALAACVKPGGCVQVPVRGSLTTGYILELKEKADYPKVYPIHSYCEENSLPEDLLRLALWMQQYYCAPLRQIIKIMLPPSIRQSMKPKEQYFVSLAHPKEKIREACIALREKQPLQASVLDLLLLAKKGLFLSELLEKTSASKSPVDSLVKKGLLSMEKVRIDRSPLQGEEYFRTQAKALNEQQKESFEKIAHSLRKGQFETHLLYGVTGSGKTEIYLQVIEEAIALQRGTIVLVPEIALTPQTIEKFRSRFEKKIAVLHHRLSQGERFDEWHRIRRKEACIVIGARSAIFSPLPDLGLIIVDEEHEGAYKQDETPCYHARDVAVVRGKMTQSTVILGSATPSMESFNNCQRGKYHLNRLSQRIGDAKLPKVTIVDMRKEYEKARGPTSFSERLIEGIKERFKRGEQVLLFLNRRGYHTTLLCQACGFIFKCPHCDLPLTFHREEKKLTCHLCAFTLAPPPQECEKCHTPSTLKYRGIGTEQVERALHALLPDVRSLRIDADTTRHKGSYEKLFREFQTGKKDLLIGTQMIAKGLHFPSVTLVGVLNCDGALQIPDFRASEHVFQLITQVAGRAGRGDLAGEVIIQTQMPENATIQLGARQDFDSFFEQESEMRRAFGFPPYCHIVKFLFSGKDAQLTFEKGMAFRELLEKALPEPVLLHPLLAAGYPKIKDDFRFQFLIRGPSIYQINREVERLQKEFSLPKTVRLHIDVDPLSTYF